MTNSQLAEKVYEALKNKCENLEEFAEYRLWRKYLGRNNIRLMDYIKESDAIEELVKLANDGTDHIICFEMIPKELAEKIAVLGAP
jgi:hypothetical protein